MFNGKGFIYNQKNRGISVYIHGFWLQRVKHTLYAGGFTYESLKREKPSPLEKDFLIDFRKPNMHASRVYTDFKRYRNRTTKPAIKKVHVIRCLTVFLGMSARDVKGVRGPPTFARSLRNVRLTGDASRHPISEESGCRAALKPPSAIRKKQQQKKKVFAQTRRVYTTHQYANLDWVPREGIYCCKLESAIILLAEESALSALYQGLLRQIQIKRCLVPPAACIYENPA